MHQARSAEGLFADQADSTDLAPAKAVPARSNHHDFHLWRRCRNDVLPRNAALSGIADGEAGSTAPHRPSGLAIARAVPAFKRFLSGFSYRTDQLVRDPPLAVLEDPVGNSS